MKPAQREYIARHVELGWRKVTLFLDPAALQGLEELADLYGSQSRGARVLLGFYAGKGGRDEQQT